MPIEVKNLKHIYSEGGPFEKVALENINLKINDGEFVGLIGHTGSGKSTLIQHFNALLKPQAGGIYIDGVNIFENKINLKSLRAKVGLVFQYPEHQLFEETVYKDIAFGPKNLGLSDDEIKQRVLDAISIVGIKESYLEKSPFELSGGQKRRVAIAGVLAMNPKILILDEPTAGLDPWGRERILSEVKALHDKKKITVILVTHSMEDIAKYGDRIIVMHEGRIAMDDIPINIFKRQEELENMGLTVPQISKVLTKLRKKGLNLPDDIFTVERASKEILKLLKTKAGDSNA